MPLNPTWAILTDGYEGNGALNLDIATKRVDGYFAQSNRGMHKDSQFLNSYDHCKSRQVLFGAYNQYVASFPWKTQSDLMLGLYAGLDKVRAIMWAYDSAGLNAGKLNAKTAADSVTAMSYLRQQAGLPVLLYGNQSDIAQIYRDAPAAKDFALVLAQYPLNQTRWNNTPNVEPEYKSWFPYRNYKMWQFASEKNWLGHDAGKSYGFAQSHSVDINVWRGTKEEMLSYLGLWDRTPEPPKPTLEQRLDKLEAWARTKGYVG